MHNQSYGVLLRDNEKITGWVSIWNWVAQSKNSKTWNRKCSCNDGETKWVGVREKWSKKRRNSRLEKKTSA